MDLLGLKSKELRELVDKCGRYVIHGCIIIGASVIVALAVAFDRVSFEAGVAAIPVIGGALAGLEVAISKSKEGKDAK